MSGTLEGLFTQILQGEDLVRERAILFLSTKIKVLLVEKLLSKDAEDLFVEQAKKVCLL